MESHDSRPAAQAPLDHRGDATHRHGRRVATAIALVVLLLSLGVLLVRAGRFNVSIGTLDPAALGEEEAFVPRIHKSDEAWRRQLTPEQFEVTRRQGTERPFSGEFWNHKEAGTYKCVCCGAPLFASQTKFDSACGWPSFYDASQPGNLRLLEDRKFGMLRVEVRCENCGAHLGHVFDDGPQPTGQRYCINSAALAFEKQPTHGKER